VAVQRPRGRIRRARAGAAPVPVRAGHRARGAGLRAIVGRAADLTDPCGRSFVPSSRTIVASDRARKGDTTSGAAEDAVLEAPAARRGVLTTSAGTHLGAFTAIDWAAFLSIGGIWGSSFLLIAIGLESFEPGVVTWLRILFGATVLWLVPAARATAFERAELPRLVALSLLWVAIPFTLFPIAEESISSGLTGLLNGAMPIFAVTIGSLMLRRVPRRTQLVGLVVGFAGIAGIALPRVAEGASQATGVALVLLATVCYGVAINIATPLTQRHGSLPVMARMLALASLWTAPFGAVGLAGSGFAWSSLGAVAGLGIMGTGVAFVLMGRLVSRVGSARASFATYLIPVVALVLGVAFRDEEVHLSSIVGVALVIAGAVLASRREAPAAATDD
jgi:drug/metabolite transporter (DMT)-like permease